MSKEYRWEVSIDGINHQVHFTQASKVKDCRLAVDNLPVSIYETGEKTIDQPFQIGNKECRLVMARKADLVVDGRLLSNGQKYTPIQKKPWWSWLFFALNLLIPIIAMGGIIPVLLGVGGISLCMGQFQAFHEKKSRQQILCCTGITALMWGLFILTIIIVSV